MNSTTKRVIPLKKLRVQFSTLEKISKFIEFTYYRSHRITVLYKQFHITELYKPGVFIVSAYSHTITDHVKNCCMQGLLKEAFTYRTYCNKLHAEESLVNSLVKKIMEKYALVYILIMNCFIQF